MNTKKYDIYSYWKDKAITKNSEVKLWNMCVPEDEAIHIVEFPDDVICWACGALPFYSPDTEKIEKLWNQDHHLNRAHILARSKGGEDIPANLFLLCPNCHQESPDTTNPQNFYAWVYHKRKYDNWMQVGRTELEKAAQIKGVDYEELVERFNKLDLDVDALFAMRKELIQRCALHAGVVSMSSKMLSFIDLLFEISEG